MSYVYVVSHARHDTWDLWALGCVARLALSGKGFDDERFIVNGKRFSPHAESGGADVPGARFTVSV